MESSVATPPAPPSPPPPSKGKPTGAREGSATWALSDRIGLAMIESLAIYVLVIALIILFRNPLLEYLLKSAS